MKHFDNEIDQLRYENMILRKRLIMCKESHKRWHLKWNSTFDRLDKMLDDARLNKFINRDAWNMDHDLANLIKKALINFKNYKRHGIPGCFRMDPKNDGKTQEQLEEIWNNILDKMIKSWDIMSMEDSSTRYLDNQKEVDDGLQLFIDYFGYLWD